MERPDGGRRRRAGVAAAAVAAVVAGAAGLAVGLAGGGGGGGAGGPRHERAPGVSSATVPGTPTTTTGAPTPAAPPGERFGINVNRLFNGGAFNAAQIAAQARAVAATGTTLARSDAQWEATEPQPPTGGVHHYDWSFDDVVAGSLAAQGIQWLPLLDYTASWAQSVPGQDHSPPRKVQDFAAFADALARRYGAGGSFWRTRPDLRAPPADTFEVWNEPDNPSFWKPAPSPSEYADLYLATRAAIRAVDPSARVIVGGLTHPVKFLPAILAARPEVRDALDGVAIHPYGPSPAAVLAHLRAARRTLERLGLRHVPLYVTEFGWTTQPAGALNYAPEARRRAYIETALAALGHTDCGIGAALLYTWVTPRSDPANPQDWYGLGSAADIGAFAAGLRGAVMRRTPAAVCG